MTHFRKSSLFQTFVFYNNLKKIDTKFNEDASSDRTIIIII